MWCVQYTDTYSLTLTLCIQGLLHRLLALLVSTLVGGMGVSIAYKNSLLTPYVRYEDVTIEEQGNGEGGVSELSPTGIYRQHSHSFPYEKSFRLESSVQACAMEAVIGRHWAQWGL